MSCVYTIDIAHPPLRSADAEARLDEMLRKISLSSSLRILKVIHGYGSSGEGGTLNLLVKNWVYTNRKRFKGVVEGDRLSPFDPMVQEIASACGITVSGDLGPATPGMTIIWVK